MLNIVIYGPPLSGKRTLLETLAGAGQLALTRFDVLIPALEVRGAVGARVVGSYSEEALDASTLSGGVFDEQCWGELVARATSAVLVFDPQQSREEEIARVIERASAMSGFPRRGCVVHSKQDLAPRRAMVALSGTPFAGWPEFRSRFDRTESMLAPFEWLVRSEAAAASR